MRLPSRLLSLLCLGLTLLVLAQPARLQAQGPTYTTVVLGLRVATGAPVVGAVAEVAGIGTGEAGSQSCTTDPAGLCSVELLPGEYVVRWTGSYQEQAIQPPTEQGSLLGHGGSERGLGMVLTDDGRTPYWLFVLLPRAEMWYPTYDRASSLPDPLASVPTPFVPAEEGFVPDPLQPTPLQSPTPLPPVATVSLPPAPPGPLGTAVALPNGPQSTEERESGAPLEGPSQESVSLITSVVEVTQIAISVSPDEDATSMSPRRSRLPGVVWGVLLLLSGGSLFYYAWQQRQS